MTNEDFDYDLYRIQQAEWNKQAEEHRAYKRDLYLTAKARKESAIQSLDLRMTDIPADVLAAIELDCRRYRQARITAALRRIAAEIIKQKK